MSPETFTEFFASYYDEIYQDKEYHKEVEYVQKLVEKYCGNVSSLLDLGCGTGTHGLLLAKKGYDVFGIDSSEAMITEAKRKLSASEETNFEVDAGEIRDMDLEQEFDAALAQFGVIGYISTNQELLESFRTIKSHLDDDGVFVFDTWYGPAVLSDPPDPVFEELNVSDGTIFKFLKPNHQLQKNLTELGFTLVHVSDLDNTTRFDETHPIRYYFEPEIALLAEVTGFELVDAHPFRSPEMDLNNEHWNATWVLRPKAE